MRFVGYIHSINFKKKTIHTLKKGNVKSHLFPGNVFNKIKKYLSVDEIIELEEENDLEGNAIVSYVLKIYTNTPRGIEYLYNKDQLSLELKSVLDSLDNKLFIDTEMTMPPYSNYNNFKSELLQAGIFVCDKDGNTLEKVNIYLKTKYELSDRTIEFLHIDLDEYKKKAKNYKEFYNLYQKLLDKYHPTVIIYGKNDKIYLENSYSFHNLKNLNKGIRYFNLCKVIREFYELKNDPGLFALYEKYYKINLDQFHNALEDSFITEKIFNAFYSDVSNNYINPKVRQIDIND